MLNRRNFFIGTFFCYPIVAAPALGQDGDLIDIDEIAKVSPSADIGNIGKIDVKQYPESVATNMASNTYSAVMGLISSAASSSKAFDEQDAKYKKFKNLFEKAVADKNDKMAEYRAGLFCSGCGQTKSQILSKGEQFPHPGMTIIKPTAQQIADFEAKLNKIIEEYKANRDSAKAPLDDMKGKAQATFNQIKHGIELWRVASNFARKIANYNDMQYAEAFDIAREQISYEISNARTQLFASSKFDLAAPILNYAIALSKRNQQLVNQENQTWTKTRNSIRNIKDNCAAQDSSMENLASSKAQEIKDFFLAGEMRFVSALLVGGAEEITAGAYGFNIEARGHYFLMGQVDYPDKLRQLPTVLSFLDKLKEVSLTSNKRTNNYDAGFIDPHEITLIEMSEHLKSLS